MKRKMDEREAPVGDRVRHKGDMALAERKRKLLEIVARVPAIIMLSDITEVIRSAATLEAIAELESIISPMVRA
jgi:hypothetical protein